MPGNLEIITNRCDVVMSSLNEPIEYAQKSEIHWIIHPQKLPISVQWAPISPEAASLSSSKIT
jgi:hypothetical protein